MSNYFAVDLCVPSFDELFPQTPSGSGAYSSESVFTPNTLRDGIRFTPSAWKTPHRQPVDTPIRDMSPCDAHQAPTSNTGVPSFGSLGTPVHQVDDDALGTSHRIPGASQTPTDDTGVTPARIMGASLHPLLSNPSPLSSPFSTAHRKISTPKRLRSKKPSVQRFPNQESGPNPLDASLFGVASTSTGPTGPSYRPPSFYTAPGTVSRFPTPPPSARTIYTVMYPSLPAPSQNAPEPTSSTLWPPLEEVQVRGDAASVEEGEVAARVERGVEGNDEEVGNSGASGSASTAMIHPAVIATSNVHSQHLAQNGDAASDGNVWLPFPDDRDILVTYLEEGLSLRHLFPSSKQGNRVRCEADLKLVGGHWRRIEVCNKTEGSLDSYQRHIKSAHLSATRGSDSRLAVDHLVNIVWNYGDKMIPRPRPCLRVEPWDEQVQNFPRLVAPPNTDQG